MKLVIVLVLLVSAIAYGSYWWYSTCGGFNSCNNPACKQDCYENGVRVR